MKTCILILLISFLAGATVSAQWTMNPNDNARLTDQEGQERHRRLLPDGNDGWFVLYQHSIDNDIDVRLARVDSVGRILWDIAVADNPDYRERGADMVSDGADGVIIAWYDNRAETTTEVYAQKIAADGSEQWSPGGVQVSPTDEQNTEESFCSKIVGDGEGGAIISFTDNRVLVPEKGIYVRRINASGQLQWNEHVAFNSSIASCTEDDYDMCSDGNGGIYIVFGRADVSNLQNNVRGMYLDRNGQRGWPNENVDLGAGFTAPIGYLINASQHSMNHLRAVPDGNGDVIVLWYDNPGVFEPEIPEHTRGQKLNAAGDLQWGASGSMLNGGDETSSGVQTGVDANGNLYFTFHDGDNYLLQKVNPAGEAQWQNGVVFRSITAGEIPPLVVTSCGDVIVGFWQDESTDMYAVRFTPQGQPVWTPANKRISAINGAQLVPMLAIDAKDRILFTWIDDREYGSSSPEFDIYMQGFNKAGELGTVISSVSGEPAPGSDLLVFPNPARHTIILETPFVSAAAEVGISDMLGKIVWQGFMEPGSESFSVDISGWTPGSYHVVIRESRRLLHHCAFVVK